MHQLLGARKQYYSVKVCFSRALVIDVFLLFSIIDIIIINDALFDLITEKKVEYNFVKKLPETAVVKEKNTLVLECELSESRPTVVWTKNAEIIEVWSMTDIFF